MEPSKGGGHWNECNIVQTLFHIHLLGPSRIKSLKSGQEALNERKQASNDVPPKQPLKPNRKPKPQWLNMQAALQWGVGCSLHEIYDGSSWLLQFSKWEISDVAIAQLQAQRFIDQCCLKSRNLKLLIISVSANQNSLT